MWGIRENNYKKSSGGERQGEILVTSSLAMMDVREEYWLL